MLLDLTAAEERAYRETLLGVYQKEVRIELLDRGGDVIDDLTVDFLGDNSSVTIDASQAVDRAASLQVLDPRHKFGFDADTYYGGDLDLTRQIRATWVTDGPLLARPVETDVITGPITLLGRSGPVVNIEVQSREALLLRHAKRTLTLKKGMRRTEALRVIAREYLTWAVMSIPDLPAKLSEAVVIHPKDVPWKVMQRIADSLNRQLFFDGSGVLRLRHFPEKATWVWRGGENGAGLISDISTDADLTDVYNRVRVVGRVPRGKKKPVSYTANAPGGHHFHPNKIGLQTKEVTNRHCRTERECKDLAERLLAHSLSFGRTVAYNVAPMPDLMQLDVVRAHDDYEDVRHRLKSAVLPLGTGDMQIGYTGPYRRRKPKPDRRRKR